MNTDIAKKIKEREKKENRCTVGENTNIAKKIKEREKKENRCTVGKNTIPAGTKRLLFVGIGTVLCVFVIFCFSYTRSTALCGYKDTLNTTFKGVSSSGYCFIRFNDVYMEKNIGSAKVMDVWIKPGRGDSDWISIKVDSKKEGTEISVFPTVNSKKASGIISVEAKRVEIFVSNQEEKAAWEKWARKVEREYWDYQEQKNKKPKLKKIIP